MATEEYVTKKVDSFKKLQTEPNSDIDSSYRSENLMDVMQKAGYEVLWLDIHTL